LTEEGGGVQEKTKEEEMGERKEEGEGEMVQGKMISHMCEHREMHSR